jgi:hypothetical protein
VADNPNLPVTGAGDANVRVRADDLGALVGVVQHIRLDKGTGLTASQIVDANPLPVFLPQGSASVVNGKVSVPTTALGTELLAASATRKGWAVMPEGAMHISVGEDTTTDHFQVQAYQVFSPPVNLTGQVKGLSASGTINVWVFAC